MNTMYTGTGVGLLGLGFAGFFTLVLIVSLWSVFWTGWALWIAARKGEKIWFIVMLVLNTVGVLEILYIFIFSKKDVFKNLKQKEESVEELQEKPQSE